MTGDVFTIHRYVGQRRRPIALSGTIAVHAVLLLLFLLLAPQLPPVMSTDRTLAAFDVAIPPPPPPPAIPKLPPRPSIEEPGGRPRAAPAPRSAPSISPASAPVTTTVPTAPPARVPQPAIGDGIAGGAAGSGGSGSGTGTGDGDGAGDGTVRYGRAEWLRYPTLAEINPFWPQMAKQRRITGRVTLACELKRPGRPDKCWTIAEEPADHGFGAAAVRMARVFRIRPITRNGATLDTPVLVPVVFQLLPETPAKR